MARWAACGDWGARTARYQGFLITVDPGPSSGHEDIQRRAVVRDRYAGGRIVSLSVTSDLGPAGPVPVRIHKVVINSELHSDNDDAQLAVDDRGGDGADAPPVSSDFSPPGPVLPIENVVVHLSRTRTNTRHEDVQFAVVGHDCGGIIGAPVTCDFGPAGPVLPIENVVVNPVFYSAHDDVQFAIAACCNGGGTVTLPVTFDFCPARPVLSIENVAVNAVICNIILVITVDKNVQFAAVERGCGAFGALPATWDLGPAGPAPSRYAPSSRGNQLGCSVSLRRTK
jgi:hypothetical protein